MSVKGLVINHGMQGDTTICFGASFGLFTLTENVNANVINGRDTVNEHFMQVSVTGDLNLNKNKTTKT